MASVDGCQREAEAYLTANRVAPASSEVPCAVPIGVFTELVFPLLWRGQSAFWIIGDSLQSSVFQEYGGIVTWNGAAAAQDARRRAKTRD